jgi:hypothetical protein
MIEAIAFGMGRHSSGIVIYSVWAGLTKVHGCVKLNDAPWWTDAA